MTAVKSLNDLLGHYRTAQKEDPQFKPPFDRVLVIRIEPFPKTAAQHAKDNTGYLSAVNGPSAAVNAMRVSTQAERAELELGLLEDSSDPHRQGQRTIERHVPMFIAALESVNAQLPVQPEEKAEIHKIIEGSKQSPKMAMRDRLEGTTQLKSDLSAWSETLSKWDDKAKQPHVPHGVRSHLETAQKHLKIIEDATKDSPDVPHDRRMVPIHSVTFRFEVPHLTKNGDSTKSSELIEPPLTWTLTEKQKKDINEAWQRIRGEQWKLKRDGTADSITPDEIGLKFFAPTKTE